MKKQLLGLLVLVSVVTLQAQKNKGEVDFRINYAEEYPTNSVYSKTEFIDSRENKEHCGIIQKGLSNRLHYVKPEINLSDQFLKILDSINSMSSVDAQKTLVFQLRDINFSEHTTTYNETGYFKFCVNAYEKMDDKYYLINKMNKVNSFQFHDVTDKNEAVAQEIISRFIALIYQSKPDYSRSYSRDDIDNIKSIELSEIPLYNSKRLNDGVYRSFEDLKNQIPNYTDIIVERRKSGNKRIKKVEIKRDNNTYQEISNKHYYALVEDGELYLCGGFFYTHLQFDEDKNLCFNSVIPKNNAVYGTFGATGAIVGAIIENSSEDKFIKMVLNYGDGNMYIAP